VRDYKVIAVLWDDHITFGRTELLKNPDKSLKPTLTIGFLYNQTKKTMTVVSDLERYSDRDEASYTVILKSCVRSVKEYGDISLKIR
jgi:hypothetical protein